MSNDLQEFFSQIINDNAGKLVISKPSSKAETYKKIVIEKKNGYYQIACYTEKQVFHENISGEDIVRRCCELTEGHYLQVNGWSAEYEHILLISKKGTCSYKKKTAGMTAAVSSEGGSHNRKKRYILEEGQEIAPLVDMGIFTKEGKVVRSMYDKYKQINRFLEILYDEIGSLQVDVLNVIDFGCGKSYLTFVLYYYLTRIKKIRANIVGLDLKADVIEKCNRFAQKYGYGGLRFELGDIHGYKAPFDVDLVVTLHACDTATDFALYNAVQWDTKLIFSVPCCQHELNGQIRAQHFSAFTRYGIIKERFCALATDAIRANLLEYCGYKAQLLEFVDFDHTPKNLLIRAVRRPVTPKAVREKALSEVKALMDEFDFKPTFYQLLDLSGKEERE